MSAPMRVLIVGAGNMANYHAEAYKAAGAELAGAVDVKEDSLARFCEKHGVAQSFGSVADALAWGEFDSASVVTPDAMHKDAALPLLAAGRHVLCEKPLAPNHADAKAMADAAAASGTVAMVHLTYRVSAALGAAHELVKAGRLGALKHVQAEYRQSWLAQDSWGDWRTQDTWLWRLSTQHGSLGVLGDVGVHLLDFGCFAANDRVADVRCLLRTFPKAAGDRIGEYPLDANDTAVLTASLAGGAVAVFQASRWMSGHHNVLHLRLFGEEGALEVVHGDGADSLRSCLGAAAVKAREWRDENPAPQPKTIERFIAAVRDGGPAEPDFAHACALQQVIDMAFAADADGGVRPLA